MASDIKLQLVQPRPLYPDSKRPDSLEEGHRFQDFVCAALARHHIILQNLASKKYQYDVGENLQGFEIKFDDWCTRSKRLSIEVAEKTRNDPSLPWTPSGILRNDNSWLYIQGNYEILFIFNKRFLVEYHRHRVPIDHIEEKLGTIQTFYLPFELALSRAIKVIEF